MSLLTSCVVMKFAFVPRGLSFFFFFFVLVSCRHFQEQIMNVVKMKLKLGLVPRQQMMKIFKGERNEVEVF